MTFTDVAQWPLPTTPINETPGEASLGDMPPNELRRLLKRVGAWVQEYSRRLDQAPGEAETMKVIPDLQPHQTRSRLPLRGPEDGEDMSEILDQFEQVIAPALTHGSHPSFFAYFTSTSSGPSILAETLAAATNVNTMLWRTGPAAAELETAALSWLRQWLGLPDSFWGGLTEGGSTSTLHALAAARQQALGPKLNEKGLVDADPNGSLRVYATDLTHTSVDKAVTLLGFGRNAIRRISMDAEYRMDPEALNTAIEEDRASGLHPFCVVATAGTTACTSVDPLDEIADVTCRNGLWLHVDAAHGGPLAILDEARPLFAGWERADSIVLNPHKWLFVPLGCSALYLRDVTPLRDAFSIAADYLETDEGVENAMDFGVALGRRFNALKLAFTLRYFGRNGYVTRLREHVRIARLFADWVDRHPNFELAAPVPMSTVCFRALTTAPDLESTNRLNKRLLARLDANGEAFLSPTKLEGRLTLRLVVSGLRVREVDVLAAWELIQRELAMIHEGSG